MIRYGRLANRRQQIVSTRLVKDHINTAPLGAHLMAQRNYECRNRDAIVKNLGQSAADM